MVGVDRVEQRREHGRVRGGEQRLERAHSGERGDAARGHVRRIAQARRGVSRAEGGQAGGGGLRVLRLALVEVEGHRHGIDGRSEQADGRLAAAAAAAAAVGRRLGGVSRSACGAALPDSPIATLPASNRTRAPRRGRLGAGSND